MRNRSLWSALLLICAVVWLGGCSNPQGLDSIQISPTTQALVVGHTAQFTITGTYGNANHPTTKQVTTGVTWTSSASAVASVTTDGLVTALAAGSTTITATAQGYAGVVSTSATVTVTAASGGGTSSSSVVSLAIIPSTQAISGTGNTVQFTAIGTTSAGSTLNLTTSSIWISSATSVATVGVTTGLANSVSSGTTTISALYTDLTSGATISGSATLTVTAATTSGGFTSISLIPNSQALTASGQTGQFIALGTTAGGAVEDVTDSSAVTWVSSLPSVASMSSLIPGQVTGLSAGTTTITAVLTNTGTDTSVVTATATVSVSLTGTSEPILSLEVIPDSITVNDYYLSGQFIAIATYSTAPYVKDVTNDSHTTWLSSTPNIFPVSNSTGGLSGASGGIVTAMGSGSATIIAEAAADDGTIQTATATFNCPQVIAVDGSSTPPSCPNTGSTGTILLSTLTVYQRGLNTTNWVITAPSATGTANVLHCGPGWTGAGGSVCTATYPVGSTVTLTSPAGAGAFGGWSSNCTTINPNPSTADGPNTCTLTLTNDDVVGVIVN